MRMGRPRLVRRVWSAVVDEIDATSPMSQEELASPLGDGMRSMTAASAAGRMGTPDDIAAAAEFLLGPHASFITGTDLLVDGGVVALRNSG
jgi:NAD(P)-dependent dehydrogenase (short-subunit alcohol dehydrogenase family)